MKRILLITSHGLGENAMVSIRLRRLIRHLLTNGWEVWCLCPNIGSFPPEPHAKLQIVACSMVTSASGFWSKCGRKLFFPIWAALKGNTLVKQFSIRHVFSTIPEIEAFVAGAGIKMARRDAILFGVEVRDPFSTNATYPWSTFKRKFYMRLEKWLWQWPDKAIYLTPEIQRIYLETFGKNQSWVKQNNIVTNGFDPAEYPATMSSASNRRIQMTYIGSFYDARHPLVFLETLKSILFRYAASPLVDVHFYGTVHGEELKARVEALSRGDILHDVVHWEGPVSHKAAIQAMGSTDVNLLITHESGSEYAIPGKLFEYMGAGKPILALTHDPLVINMMKEGNLGWVCQTREDLLAWFETYLPRAEAVRSHQPNTIAIQHYQIDTIHKRWEDFLEVSG